MNCAYALICSKVSPNCNTPLCSDYLHLQEYFKQQEFQIAHEGRLVRMLRDDKLIRRADERKT